MKQHVDHPFQSPAVLSICPGNLGIERGVEDAIGRVRVLTYVEIEAYIIANLVAGMESGVLDPAPIWTNVETFDARVLRGKIHGIIGGYPCPGESLAGLREGHLYKGFLWPSIGRIIKAAKPVWGFFENVDDHLTGTYPIVQRSLRQMGYAVEAGIYSAEEIGAPHERQRIFIFALANGYRDELRRRFAKIPRPTKAHERKARIQYWQRLWDELGNSGENVADTDRLRVRAGSKSAGRKTRPDATGSRTGPELGNAQGDDQRGQRDGGTGQQPHRGSGKKLAHSDGSGFPQLGDGDQQGEAGHARTGLPGAKVGNANLVGQQGYDDAPGNPGQTDDQSQQWGEVAGADPAFAGWPAGQGNFQYDFEEKRTVESGVGCTINGYNFKEDLLRSLGNMVVQQSASKAFRELFVKLILE